MVCWESNQRPDAAFHFPLRAQNIRMWRKQDSEVLMEATALSSQISEVCPAGHIKRGHEVFCCLRSHSSTLSPVSTRGDVV